MASSISCRVRKLVQSGLGSSFGGGDYMVGWRTKFVFMLIIYSAGFATAIYLTAPPPGEGEAGQSPKNRLSGTVDSRKLAGAMNTGIHKVADLSKELAIRATALIREQVKEAQARKK